MQTVKRFTVRVTPTDMPLLKKKCNKCSCEQYYCSGKFRMNSQKKQMDIWLIYRCKKCDNTLNLEIYSRIRPDMIDAELYKRMIHNDAETAFRFSFDNEMLRRNHVQADYSQVEYILSGDTFVLEDIPEDIIKISIESAYDFELRLSSFLRTYLNVSSSKLEKLLDTGIIYLPDNQKWKRTMKIQQSTNVLIDNNKWKEFMRKEKSAG